jgi:hypothetical protein
MTATYNLVAPQATTFTFAFRPQTDGVNWNLTGYTATMTVRPFAGSSTTTLLATTANGKININTSTSIVTVNFTAADTNIKAETYAYDLMLYTGPTVTRLLEGKFLVPIGVTV